jgi:hypothetical protein
MNLIEELRLLIESLDAHQIQFALCGGLAMAVYSQPRATLDIDIMVEESALQRVIETSREIGYTFDAGEMRFNKGRIRIHRLTKPAQEPENTLTLDLLIVTPEIYGIWTSRIQIEWEHGSIPVVSPEGLIRLKTLRGSGRDRDDIEYLKGLSDET